MDYGHGDDLYKYEAVNFKANFSSNVWHQGAAKPLVSFLKEQLNTIENYPAPSAESLTKSIEKHHHLPNQSTLVTNGATEAFYLITNTFHSDSVTICTPSFSEYEQASKANHLKLHFIDRASILQHQFNTTLAFICNPNNPDGFENSIEDIEQLAKSFPNTYFIIDEAYTEFTNSNISCISLVNLYPNIVLIKSLTKLFCIPGLRLGYIISNPNFISKLMQHKMPWNVNSLALHAGEFIFKNYDALAPNFNTCFKNLAILKKEINELDGFEVIPSNTSYFLIRMNQPKATELKKHLIHKHQLLIRDASNFRTLDPHYIRIASQSLKQNKLLINALKQWNN
ncbi:hypothetical protein A8C32_08135 [Flavivirga aquatica]|uniref:Aminotransferase class I/classII large domain-containing protein n=1 Tax=Flavivirga aquatica TaxID=1849968 RepID=A0A1E5SJ41_9FLAO|nr:histidinol-phosphate transaminase [Flavivirga aquatica]OEJ99134.1 hypothetical protein A8C32_08135 [Flavivirga aquatica]